MVLLQGNVILLQGGVVLVLWSDWDIRLSFRRSGLGSFSFKGGGLGCFSFKGGGLGSFSFKGGSLGCFLWGDFWEGAAPLTTPLWFYWNYCFSLYRNYWFWMLYWNYWFCKWEMKKPTHT